MKWRPVSRRPAPAVYRGFGGVPSPPSLRAESRAGSAASRSPLDALAAQGDDEGLYQAAIERLVEPHEQQGDQRR